MKTCCSCGKSKETEEFVKDNRRKDGYSTLCKECKRERDRIRYEKLKDNDEFHSKKLEHNRKYKEKHKEEILQKAAEYNSRPEVVERKANWHQAKQNHKTLNQRINDMFRGAKSRAFEKGIPFTITEDDIVPLEYCPILKIKLNWEGGPRQKNTPSLDRIIPEKGYIKGNICVISFLANIMKSYANSEELIIFSNNIADYMKNEEIVRTTENKNL